MENEDIEKIYRTLQSIKMWLGCSVNNGCDAAISKQVMIGDQLKQVG